MKLVSFVDYHLGLSLTSLYQLLLTTYTW